MAALVQRYTMNDVGRDFACGDIHGAYDLLDMGLESIGFDPEVDRLFCVGDLVDRGNRSADCGSYLQQGWFQAVRGNHDDFFCEVVGHDGYMNGIIHECIERMWGTQWLNTVSVERRKAIKAQMEDIPLVIEIETKLGLVGIVHSQVTEGSNWGEFVKDIRAGNTKAREDAIKNRARIKNREDQPVEGVERVFHGHEIQPEGVTRLGNRFYIDTGACCVETGGRDTTKHPALTLVRIDAPEEAIMEEVDFRQPVRILGLG